MPLINIFLLPSVATLTLILMEIFWWKRQNSSLYFIRFFCFLSAIRLLFFIAHIEATEETPKLPTFPNCKMWALSQQEYDRYNYLYNDHMMWGHSYFQDAHQLTSYIKKKTDRERAEQLFRQFILTVVTAYDYKTFISALLITLSEYGIEAFDAHNDMTTLLEKAKYNYEMAVFYLDILMRDGRGPSYSIETFSLLSNKLDTE